MAPRGPDKQFDRDLALERAMQLFWSKGYEATGVAELLEAMQIGRQSMYDTFGNKRQLFLTALNEYGRREISRVVAVLKRPGSPMGNLRELLDQLERGDRGHDDWGCLVGNTIAELATRDPEVAAMARRGLGVIRDAIRDTLLRARDAGEIGDDADVEGLASLVVSALQGTALLIKADRDMDFGHEALRGLRAVLAVA